MIFIFISQNFKGSSITNGFCCYALTIENGDYTIWYNGQPFKVNEPHNPVRVVSGLINADNVYKFSRINKYFIIKK